MNRQYSTAICGERNRERERDRVVYGVLWANTNKQQHTRSIYTYECSVSLFPNKSECINLSICQNGIGLYVCAFFSAHILAYKYALSPSLSFPSFMCLLQKKHLFFSSSVCYCFSFPHLNELFWVACLFYCYNLECISVFVCVSIVFFLGCVMFLLDNIAESSLCYCIVHSIVAAILSFRNGLFGRRFVGVVAAVVVFVFFFSVLPYSASVQ